MRSYNYIAIFSSVQLLEENLISDCLTFHLKKLPKDGFLSKFLMSQEQIAEFIQITGATKEQASRYLHRNDFDVKKAVRAYYGGRMPPSNDAKTNAEWYAGGSKSGVAVISGNPDGFEPVPLNNNNAPQPQPISHFTGTAHNIGGAPKPAAASGPKLVQVKTDYTTPGAPKTRIRVDLGNGSTLTLSLNLSATVGDIKQYIAENCPGADPNSIQLHVTMPPQALNDDSATVESANLKMAALKCQF